MRRKIGAWHEVQHGIGEEEKEKISKAILSEDQMVDHISILMKFQYIVFDIESYKLISSHL